jgi:hypothetical protein
MSATRSAQRPAHTAALLVRPRVARFSATGGSGDSERRAHARNAMHSPWLYMEQPSLTRSEPATLRILNDLSGASALVRGTAGSR